MKQFIKGIPPTISHAFKGYTNCINIDHIIDIYKEHIDDDKNEYFAIVTFGNHIETWEINEKDYLMLLELDKNG